MSLPGENSAEAPLQDWNPFATRATRPGSIDYLFSAAESGAALVERLRENDWWGQIVGPHGSGKSTLLHALLPLLEQADRRVRHFTLHRGERRLSIERSEQLSWGSNTQVIVDGYEQLGHWNRMLLKRLCRRRQVGLLVTTHVNVGFPTIYSTAPSLEVTQQLVGQLQAAGRELITPDDVARSFECQQGNLREVFFELYDLYEQRRRRSPEGG